MAVEDEIFRIRYQAEGEAAIKRAQAELERLGKVAERAVEKFKGGTLDQQRFAKASEMLGQRVAAAKANLEAYERAAGRGGGTRNLGMAALEAGRALEDLNYGLIGVMNNIPQLAMALGAGAGLTGIIATLGAAVLFLSRNWSTVTDALKVGIPNDTISSFERAKTELQGIDEALDAIAKKPRISLAEKIQAGTLRIRREDLARQVAEGETLDDLFGRQSDRGKFVAGAVADMVANSGMDRASFGAMLAGAMGEAGMVAPGQNATAAARRLLGEAGQGDAFAAGRLADALQAGGGRGAQLGEQLAVALSPNAPAAEFGPTREMWEEGLEAANQRTAEQPGDAMVAEFRKLQEQWAADAAPAFAGEAMGPGRDVLDKAIEDAKADRADQFAAARLQLGLAEMGGGPKAPSVIAAESFAAQLQASGAAKPTELMREQLDRLEALEKLAETTNRILERRGLLGP